MVSRKWCLIPAGPYRINFQLASKPEWAFVCQRSFSLRFCCLALPSVTCTANQQTAAHLPPSVQVDGCHYLTALDTDKGREICQGTHLRGNGWRLLIYQSFSVRNMARARGVCQGTHPQRLMAPPVLVYFSYSGSSGHGGGRGSGGMSLRRVWAHTIYRKQLRVSAGSYLWRELLATVWFCSR